MKHTKKLVALVMVFALLAALSVSAFAAGESETATITVTKPETSQVDTTNTTNETYTAYLILNATETEELLEQNGLNAGDSGITYYTTAANAALLGDYFTFAAGEVNGTAVQVVTATTLTADNQVQAKALLAIAKANSFTSTPLTASADGSSFAASLPIGFYVIESSLGVNVVALTTDMSIAQKNEYPTFTKAFTNTDDAYVAIGDTVEYTITVTVPITVNQAVVIHDTLDAGLTYNNDGGDYASADGQDITFTIPASVVEGATESVTVTLTYSAHVEETVTSSGEYKNTAYLTYSHYQSVTQELTSKTNKIALLKYDGADTDKANLAGAVFELHDASGAALTLVGSGESYRLADTGETGVTQFTTTDVGNIVIDGVDSDLNYQFVEIQAPEGYNALDADASPAQQPAADNSTVVEVENNTGTVLPSTGGIGTTMFYIFGSLLVVGAGVVLVAKRRVSE